MAITEIPEFSCNVPCVSRYMLSKWERVIAGLPVAITEIPERFALRKLNRVLPQTRLFYISLLRSRVRYPYPLFRLFEADPDSSVSSVFRIPVF